MNCVRVMRFITYHASERMRVRRGERDRERERMQFLTCIRENESTERRDRERERTQFSPCHQDLYRRASNDIGFHPSPQTHTHCIVLIVKSLKERDQKNTERTVQTRIVHLPVDSIFLYIFFPILFLGCGRRQSFRAPTKLSTPVPTRWCLSRFRVCACIYACVWLVLVAICETV